MILSFNFLSQFFYLLISVRQKRTVFTRFVGYVDDIPQGASEEANRELHKKFFKPEQEGELRKVMMLLVYFVKKQAGELRKVIMLHVYFVKKTRRGGQKGNDVACLFCKKK